MQHCRSCQGTELTPFLSLGSLPLADGLLRKDQLSLPESRYPLEVAFCSECALVQIMETVPPEELFCKDYPYYSSFSDALLKHSKNNVDGLVTARSLDTSSFVVELASNDGYLLQFYNNRGIPVLGIDPAEGPAKAAVEGGIPTLCSFFDENLAAQLLDQGKQADVIHANNVLAHVPDLNGFVRGIGTLLKDDGVAVIEVPYVKDLIDHSEFDTIYHEHLCYFSVSSLTALFRRHGLFLNHVDHLSIHGGSLRLFVGKHDETSDAVRLALGKESESSVDKLQYYEDFALGVEVIKRELLAHLTQLRESGKTLAAYGAAAKGAVLLNYVGIGREMLDFVVDRNVHKQGRYMPGVHIPILAPEELLKSMPDYVLLLPWNFKHEILEQQEEYRRKGGKFIVPIPHLEIV